MTNISTERLEEMRLLPCPFCGATTRHMGIFSRDPFTNSIRGVECSVCPASMVVYPDNDPYASEEELNAKLVETALAWNRRSLDKGEVVAWLHTFTLPDGHVETEVNTCPQHPFGRSGRDYSDQAIITSTPLYASPQPNKGEVVKPLVDYLWQEFCELPDRTSPEEYPDMALVTLSELTAIVETYFEIRSPKAGQMAVMQLAWEAESNGDFNAGSVVGEYHISLPCLTWNLVFPDGKIQSFDTLKEAKAAAQADYETRIRSALISQPAPKGVEITKIAAMLETALLSADPYRHIRAALEAMKEA